MARQGYRECIVYGISGLNKVLDNVKSRAYGMDANGVFTDLMQSQQQ